MKASPPDTVSPALAVAGAVCVGAALALAVFYHGPQIPLLAAAQSLLVVWILLSLLAACGPGVSIPLTPLSFTLALFWAWLALSLLWSPVPVTSTYNFWWVGGIVAAFCAYTIAPSRERVWVYASRFVLLGALALCAHALTQLFLWREPPRSVFMNIHSFGALMMLVALPLAAHWLIARRGSASRPTRYALGAALFVLFFTIAATEGRGTALSLGMGMALLAWLAVRGAGAQAVAVVIGLLVGAYTLANLSLHGSLVEGRLATLVDPASAAAPRLLIWRGSWQMLMDNPWWGIGLGAYYLAWPPYRHPDDTTLGFFAHNDYLQIWIEAGLPALALLLAVFVSVLTMFVRSRRSGCSAEVQLETLGLFAGLFAVAAHSFVDFNLYVLPISLGAGLALGRFHELAAGGGTTREFVWRPQRLLSPRAYSIVVVLLALFPLTYFVSLGVSDHLYKRGFVLAAEGRLPEADDAFTWAERLMPGDDKVLAMHADLYRHVLARLPPDAEDKRRPLYEAALDMLGEAAAVNPYRPLIHSVHARLLHENPDLAGPDWRGRAEAAYQAALARDPRAFLTRMAYARLLEDQGRPEDADRVLEAGARYWYYPSEPALAYLEMAAKVARRLGREADAADIEQRAAEMRGLIARLAPARPIVPDLVPPTAASAG